MSWIKDPPDNGKRSSLRHLAWVFAAGGLGFGCSLLTPYPGGEDPVLAFLPSNAPGIPGAEGPLVDPPIDPSVTAESLIDQVVARPGAAFPIHLDFVASNENVVGGGIRFPGSDEVQWTFVEGVNGEPTGEIRFGYVLADEACDDVGNLCHEINTEQFAVTQVGGEFQISEPVDVVVVLQCGTCESASCVDALPDGCMSCGQPDVCVALYEACFAPGQPGEDQVQSFNAFLGSDGALWSSDSACAQGEALCQGLLDGGSCAL